jgi:hypothetical protein
LSDAVVVAASVEAASPKDHLIYYCSTEASAYLLWVLALVKVSNWSPERNCDLLLTPISIRAVLCCRAMRCTGFGAGVRRSDELRHARVRCKFYSPSALSFATDWSVLRYALSRSVAENFNESKSIAVSVCCVHGMQARALVGSEPLHSAPF